MTENHAGVPLTDDEHAVLRRATFGAVALVSRSDPGFFAMFKESMAGSAALQDAPAEIRALLSEGSPFPSPPTGSPAEVEESVLADLRRAVQVLCAKSPRQVVGFRDVVLAAATRAAEASDGLAPTELETIERIRDALSGGLAGDRPVGDTASDAPRHD